MPSRRFEALTRPETDALGNTSQMPSQAAGPVARGVTPFPLAVCLTKSANDILPPQPELRGGVEQFSIIRTMPMPDRSARSTNKRDKECNRPGEGTREPWFLWFCGGLFVLTLGLIYLESTAPYYFCQDDALVTELPHHLLVCRSVWEGRLPEYNPFNQLGEPMLSQGGATYPPRYLAYAIARHLLGNEFALCDVFAIMHLLIGYVAVFALGRQLGFRCWLAAVAGLTVVVAGPNLINGRCWGAFVVPVALQPLLALCADRLRLGSVSWRWSLSVAVLSALLYHCGFPQLFVFVMGGFVVHCLLLSAVGAVPWQRLMWPACALLLGASFCLPVFHVQNLLAASMLPMEPAGEGMLNHVLSVFLPYPLSRDYMPNHFGNKNTEFAAHAYYFGSLFAVLWGAALFDLVRKIVRRDSWLTATQHVWTLSAILFFWASLGPAAGIWKLVAFLPAGLRNSPIRIYPSFVFYCVMSGAMLLENRLRQFEFRLGRCLWLPAVACLLLLYHVSLSFGALYTYGFKPYPSLPPEIVKLVGGDEVRRSRIIGSFKMRSDDPSYPTALPHSLSAVYGIGAMHGYDPVTTARRRYAELHHLISQNVPAALRAYGVRWCLLHRTVTGSYDNGTNPYENQVLFDVRAYPRETIKTIHSVPSAEEFVAVVEFQETLPLCFFSHAPDVGYPLDQHCEGFDVELPENHPGGRLVFGFLKHDEHRAYADTREVAVSDDDWMRVVAEVPPGAKRVEVRYQPDWKTGLIRGALTLGVGCVALTFLVWRQRRSEKVKPGTADAKTSPSPL
ncbi:MAG: hypothetical protein C0483_01155 [Pirellula sp.]|nr:hypothetical protein [Pirellula sp.]